uniref:Helicase ATP-binding domain-containing protein n=1 Tax=Nothoprocta perdicaria TaxID=30464 RepID=A0A8C7EDS1_NOTPE
MDQAGALARVQEPQPAPRVPARGRQLAALQLVQQASAGAPARGPRATPRHATPSLTRRRPCPHRQNCILADEMGLGKTIQSIAFLQEVYGVGVRGPFLVIAPLSTITNWEREFNTWTEMNTIAPSRRLPAQGRLIPGAYKFDALITTFEMILSDCPELREIEWRCVVIDEAHRLKNRNCKLLDSLKHMDLVSVLLTGTPLQNTVEELFSLLHFLEPSQFPSEAEFLKDFGDLKTEEQAILKPMMLRRLKEDVEKNLAPKQETIIEVELTNIQKKYYRAILEKNFSFLSKGAGHTNMPNLLNTMMELRKCCNHPYLINGEGRVAATGDNLGTHPPLLARSLVLGSTWVGGRHELDSTSRCKG